jgi:hypothetical protein
MVRVFALSDDNWLHKKRMTKTRQDETMFKGEGVL